MDTPAPPIDSADAWPRITALISRGGHVTFGRIASIDVTAVAADERTTLAALIRRDGESIPHLLGRLNEALGKVQDRRNITEPVRGTTGSLFADAPEPVDASAPAPARPSDAKVAENRTVFRQRASDPRASLQPWMDELLNGHGLIRCYATEDANPTKQLKNKLAQAAPAKNGLLVLLLADLDAYTKARGALIQRWHSNAEWSKSVACVALAYPLGAPDIRMVVEQTSNRWSALIRDLLFPEVEIVRAKGFADVPS